MSPFKRGEEIKFIQGLDIGLLPLPKDDFISGKSPIKSLQYMACGVVTAGNIHGATKEILNKNNSVAICDDWLNPLEKIILDKNLGKALTEKGLIDIKKHSIDLCWKMLKSIIFN